MMLVRKLPEEEITQKPMAPGSTATHILVSFCAVIFALMLALPL